MCEPTLIISAGMGVAKASAGIAEQNRQHSAQVAAVNRSNAIARQSYINDLQISKFKDQEKGQIYTAKLKNDAASKAAYFKQREINQVEANRASEAAQQELSEKITKAQFESQANLAKSIQAQGQVLASGLAAGQSMMLELDQVERDLGMEQAQLDATVFDATKAYGISQFGIDLDKFSADTAAANSISVSAAVSPTASFKTLKPIMQQAPRRPSKLGPILGGISTAFSTGSAIGGEGYWKDTLKL